MKIGEFLKEHTLLCDGAMGTYYAAKFHNETLVERENFEHPERIAQIHGEYLDGGAGLLRTNTFATNLNFFDSIEEMENNIMIACQIAKSAVEAYYEKTGLTKETYPVYVAADIGTIYDMEQKDDSNVLAEYHHIVDTFVSAGMDIFWLETQVDVYYLKRLLAYIKEKAPQAYVMVSFSMDKTAYSKGGLQFDRMVRLMSEMDEVNAYGLNCGMEAAHMYQLLKNVTFPSEKPVIALPNAGYPYQLRGKTIYGKNESYFQKMVLQIADLGIDLVGGCCGTTPDYLKEIAEQLKGKKKIEKKTGSPETPAVSRTESVFWKKLQSGEKPFVVELDPPSDIKVEKLVSGAQLLKEHRVDLLTLSDSPMARSRMDASLLGSKIQRETGIYVMPHLSCRDRNVISLRGTMLGDYVNDLRHFLVVTGDPIAQNDRNTITQVFDYNSIKFMGLLQEMNEDQFYQDRIVYGGALNYQGVGVDAIARRMKLKMEQGCSFFLTQPIYADADVERIKDLKDRTGAKIIGGIMPLVSRKNALFIANEMPGMHVPPETLAYYEEGMSRSEYEEVAIRVSVEIARKMSSIVDGYYFMTPFNRVELICNIIERIREENL